MSESVASASEALNMGGLDPDLLREMQEAGYLSDDDLRSALTPVSPVNVTDEDRMSAAQELETHEARQELYAEQESHADLVEPENEVREASEVGTSKPKRERKARAASAGPKAPRSPRLSGFVSPGAYVASFVGSSVKLIDGDSEFDVQDLVDGIKALKIIEKACNLFDHFHKGKPLSVFTQIALDTLKREGQISGKRLVEVYMSTDKKGAGSYGEGTARSQAQQEITLLKRVGIVTGSGIANPNSTYWRKIVGE